MTTPVQVTDAWGREGIRACGETYQAGDTGEPADRPPAEVVPLLGCISGYAKGVIRNICCSAISAKLKDFLLDVYARSFGDAGFQRRADRENPGGSCAFDNAAWARELGIQRQHIYRLRVKAEALGILFYDSYDSYAADMGAGRLRWNLAFDEWPPLDPPSRRHAMRA